MTNRRRVGQQLSARGQHLRTTSPVSAVRPAYGRRSGRELAGGIAGGRWFDDQADAAAGRPAVPAPVVASWRRRQEVSHPSPAAARRPAPAELLGEPERMLEQAVTSPPVLQRGRAAVAGGRKNTSVERAAPCTPGTRSRTAARMHGDAASVGEAFARRRSRERVAGVAVDRPLVGRWSSEGWLRGGEFPARRCPQRAQRACVTASDEDGAADSRPGTMRCRRLRRTPRRRARAARSPGRRRAHADVASPSRRTPDLSWPECGRGRYSAGGVLSRFWNLGGHDRRVGRDHRTRFQFAAPDPASR